MSSRVVQQHLTMTTRCKGGLRSEAIGWSAEDPARFVPGGGHETIGRTPGWRGPYIYSTPMAALADGWRLLAPPEHYKENDEIVLYWWFVRDVVTDTPAPGVA